MSLFISLFGAIKNNSCAICNQVHRWIIGSFKLIKTSFSFFKQKHVLYYPTIWYVIWFYMKNSLFKLILWYFIFIISIFFFMWKFLSYENYHQVSYCNFHVKYLFQTDSFNSFNIYSQMSTFHMKLSSGDQKYFYLK